VKNGEPIDVQVPATLVPHLRRHIEVHRPRLLDGAADHGCLFVGRAGRPLAYSWIYNLFRYRGAELIGQPINPHAIRHAIATGLLEDDPRAVATAGAALAHRGSRSVNEVYDRSGRGAAEAEWRRLRRRAARSGC
jgi:integrase